MASRFTIPLFLLSACIPGLHAQPAENNDSTHLFDIHAAVTANAGTGNFAPYYNMSEHYGKIQQTNGIQGFIEINRPFLGSYFHNSYKAPAKRFDYGFGAEAIAEYTSSTDYLKYNAPTGEFEKISRHPGRISLRQLWAGVKWRSLHLTAGMREHTPLCTPTLGSGDLVYSRNARPIPQVRIGFADFQDIPFTNGWVQIFGDISYGRFADSDYLESHYNYYNSFITTGVYMQYSRIYFNIAQGRRFSGTIGMQHATQFGGTWHQYRQGEEWSVIHNPVHFKDFINAFFPWSGGSSQVQGETDYFNGNHLGSWDLRLNYAIDDAKTLSVYLQSPWEDGSGIGKLNGFDGVWGICYLSGTQSAVSQIVVEYVDLTNQSGPSHWAPGDYDDSGIPGQATGADDYYNNYMYDGWANYGMAIGSPFVKSPVYNTDGYLRFTDNRVRGFHIAAEGYISKALQWQAMFSFRTSWGTPMLPAIEKRRDTSMMAGISWAIPKVKRLTLSGQLAFDTGELYGDNFGGMLTLRYSLPVFRKK